MKTIYPGKKVRALLSPICWLLKHRNILLRYGDGMVPVAQFCFRCGRIRLRSPEWEVWVRHRFTPEGRAEDEALEKAKEEQCRAYREWEDDLLKDLRKVIEG